MVYEAVRNWTILESKEARFDGICNGTVEFRFRAVVPRV